MTDSSADILGQRFTLRNGAVLKNRMLKSAMSETLGSPTHAPSQGLVNLYRRWANGGIGVLVTGNVMVDHRYLGEPANVAVETERDLDILRAWAAAGTDNGTHLWMQLNHPGKQAPAFLNPDHECVAPSAVPFESSLNKAFPTPRALRNDEIEDLIERFGRTAAIAEKAGFTGAQIHGAHGYLVSQFLSPKANIRTDQWGGSLEKRMAFPLAVYKSIRRNTSDGFVVSIKINSADFQQGGFSEEESLVVMQALDDAGIDLIEISGGTYEAAAMMGARQKESTRRREAYFLAFAEQARTHLKTALCVTGGFRSDQGLADAIASGAVDLVGMARPIALDPDAPARILSGAGYTSPVKPVRTGIKAIDKAGMLDLTFYENQMALLARGKDTRPDMNAWESIARVAARQGLQAFKKRRAK